MASTFKDVVDALEWYALDRTFSPIQHRVLRALSNALLGSGVTAPGGVVSFGDLVLGDATMVDQTPTGATGLIPGVLAAELVNPGRDRLSEQQPSEGGFRR